MSVGLGLLKAVLSYSIPFSRLSEEGLSSVHFLQGDEAIAYGLIQSYAVDVGGLPSLETVAVHLQNPSALRNMVQEPFEFWVPRVRDRHRVLQIDQSISSVRSLIDANRVSDAVDEIGNLYLSLRESFGTRLVDSLSLKQEALRHHNQLQSHNIPVGIPYGFPYLDEVSGGMLGGDLIAIVGEPGVGKTSLALEFSRSAHRDGRSVLFLSTEVTLLQLGRRLLAMDATENLSDLKLGRLSSFRSAHLAERLSEEASNGSEAAFEFLPGGIYASVGDIILVAKERRPSLITIDGAYLLRMAAKNSKLARWDVITHVLEELKSFCLTQDIPILATFQFNRKSPGSLEGIAGTFAISQLASVVLSLEFERREDAISPTEARYRILKVLKGREGETGSLRVLFDFAETSIHQDRVLSGGVLREILGDSRSEFDDGDQDAFTAI